MDNSNSVAAQSAWFRQYESEVNAGRQKGSSNKKVLVIIPVLLIGAMIAMMINNGAMDTQQGKNGVFALAGIGIVLLVMILILTGKYKKKDAAAITRKDLEALFVTPDEAAKFDAQINAAPVFQVMNNNISMLFVTPDYLGTRFLYLGDKTYRFIRLKDISVLHTVTYDKGHCDVEFRDTNGKVLLTWVADDKGKVEEVKEGFKTNLNMDLSSM